MRELAAYFCPRCGCYAYFHLPKNAICHNCNVNMKRLNISYQKFMSMDHEERDRFISCRIVDAFPTLSRQICSAEKLYNERQLIAHLTEECSKLETENQTLAQTVNWMHQTIWDQLRCMKDLERQLKNTTRAGK